MFFLIEYNRRKGELVCMRRFADAEWSRAVDAQFALEKSVMQRGIDHKVVLLQSKGGGESATVVFAALPQSRGD